MYKAVLEKDGTYTIHDVEIFLPYADEKIDPPVMNADDLNLFVINHENQKAQAAKKFGANKKYLPRVHISHHEDGGTENNEGAGFLDNLRVNNEILYADLVKVPAEVVDAIGKGKYPYRSVEFVGDMPDVRIIGLALLESREPYHKLPMLTEIERAKAFQKSMGKSPTRIFQNLRNLVDVRKFNKEKRGMDVASYAKKYGCSEEELTEKLQKFMDSEYPQQMQDDEDVEQMQDDEDVEAMQGDEDVESFEDDEDVETFEEDDEDVEMFEGSDRYSKRDRYNKYEREFLLADEDDSYGNSKGYSLHDGMLKVNIPRNERKAIDNKFRGDEAQKKKANTLLKLAKKNPEKYLKKYREMIDGKDVPSPPGFYPSSKLNFQSSVLRELASLKREVSILKNEKNVQKFQDQLRKVCAEKGLDYAHEMNIVRKFQNNRDRKDYIFHLKKRPSVSMPTETASTFSAKTTSSHPRIPSTRISGDVAKKFQSEPAHIQQLANKLQSAYSNSMKTFQGSKLNQFQQMWKSADDYVTFFVSKEKKTPGYCETNRVFS